jgi:alkylation response protein AidB-like acyl-CoA dehydrogenase
MTAVEVGATTVLDAIRKLSPEIAERSDEIERAKVVPPDLIERIADAGAFRMFVPRQYGGEQMSLPEAVAVIEEISRADASTAWTVMIGADVAPILARLPRHVLDSEVYRDGPDAMARAVLAPKGIAVPAEGGYVVSGQWSLASGCYPHEWVMGNCLVLENGQPRMTELGVPEMKLAMLPTGQAQFLDTWHSLGLRGTNSTDFVVQEVFVAEQHTCELFGPATVDVPMFRLPIRLALGPTHSAVVLGIAEGAVADVRELAKTKRPAFNPGMRLAEDPVFQFRLGQLDIQLAAVRASTEKETQRIWDVAVAGGPVDPLAAVRSRAMVARAHSECVEIVNEAFGLAGSSAMYNTSTLQRRLRDIRTAAQHLAASAEIYQIAGALLVDEDVPPAALV